jgi:hypothetical protein
MCLYQVHSVDQRITAGVIQCACTPERCACACLGAPCTVMGALARASATFRGGLCAQTPKLAHRCLTCFGALAHARAHRLLGLSLFKAYEEYP